MRLIIFFFFVLNLCQAQIKISSWNLKNFGKSKTQKEIEFIVQSLKHTDIIAIQEVVAGYGGPQAVAQLAAELNRKGTSWDYIVSPPTNSSPYKSERYAYLWKTTQVKIAGRAFLDTLYTDDIEREPYIIHFKHKENTFTLVNFHAIPKKQQPERELKFLKYFPEKYNNSPLIFLGDFNCPESHSVFNPLKKMGYISAFTQQKTSLRQKCIDADCLASEYDNFLLHPDFIKLLQSEVIHFYQSFENITLARLLSDHVPLIIEIDF